MPRILVVDDEKDVQQLFREILLTSGHEAVETADSADEAVRRFHASGPAPDLTLMDHRMPGKSGLEATREILAVRPDARILVISADATVRGRWKEAGALGFIEKPVDWRELQRAIDKALPGAEVHVESPDDGGEG